MRPRALCNKINELFERGLEEGVFLAIQTHLLHGITSREILGPSTNIGMLSEGGVSVPEYLELLDSDRYSAVFDDHALLMVQCIFENSQILAHRYGYVPCPVKAELLAGRPEDISIADWIRLILSSSGIEAFISVGTYRFDFTKVTPARLSDPHPASHFTFAAARCRLPVRSPMSISHILSFLFDNFYRHHRPFWNDFAPHLTGVAIADTITEGEQMLHHLTWADEP
jgi:hypothetical protein